MDVFLALDRDARHGFDYATNPLAPELVERLQPVASDWTSIDQDSMAPEVCDSTCGAWGFGCKGFGGTAHQSLCMRDIEARERTLGRRYDWVLLGRPDVVLGRALTPDALYAAARASMAVYTRNGTVFSRPGRCNTETYCRSDTWVLATRRAADVYVHATMREFHRRTGCDQARAALIEALDGTGAKVHVHKHDKHESVCVECKLYHTLRVMGVEACAGVADDFIARQGAIRDDGSVDFGRVVGDGSLEELVRGDRSPIRFEHPVAGRCGATAAEVLARPRD